VPEIPQEDDVVEIKTMDQMVREVLDGIITIRELLDFIVKDDSPHIYPSDAYEHD